MTTTSPPADPPRPPRRWASKLLVVLLSTVFSLGLAELVVGVARGFAFPQVNLFVADAALGVRLEANAETRLRCRDGRVTSIETNAEGFRDDAWRPAVGDTSVAGRTLILGDSQALGYHVAVEDTFAARLEALGPHDVLNAAAPTWGPPEFTRVLVTLAPRYRPETVVVVANQANDWEEAEVPNVARTSARDGWAMSPDRAREGGDFPGRRWLLGQSHLVYAVRALVADRTGAEEAVLAGRVVAMAEQRLRADTAGSALTRSLLAARQLCARYGCRLIVTLLPLDVQVDPSAWAKYGHPPRPTHALDREGDALLSAAAGLGLTVVDLRPALAATPGAFLRDDYHLAAAGHDAVARAVAPTLENN